MQHIGLEPVLCRSHRTVWTDRRSDRRCRYPGRFRDKRIASRPHKGRVGCKGSSLGPHTLRWPEPCRNHHKAWTDRQSDRRRRSPGHCLGRQTVWRQHTRILQDRGIVPGGLRALCRERTGQPIRRQPWQWRGTVLSLACVYLSIALDLRS